MVKERSNEFGGYGQAPTEYGYGTHSSTSFPQARPTVGAGGDLRRDKSTATSIGRGNYEMDNIGAGSVGMPVPNPSAPTSRSGSGANTPLPVALQAGPGQYARQGQVPQGMGYGLLDR
jgi:hypothetical protein